MTPFKTILLSFLVSLTACVCFHWPFMILVVLYFLIGVLVGRAACKAHSQYDEVFVALSIFMFLCGLMVLLIDGQFLRTMSYIIPGYKIEINKDES